MTKTVCKLFFFLGESSAAVNGHLISLNTTRSEKHTEETRQPVASAANALWKHARELRED